MVVVRLIRKRVKLFLISSQRRGIVSTVSTELRWGLSLLGQYAVSNRCNSTRCPSKLSPSPQRLGTSVATSSGFDGHVGSFFFFLSRVKQEKVRHGLHATLSGDIFAPKIQSDTNFPASKLQRAGAVCAGGWRHWRCLQVAWEMHEGGPVTLQPLTFRWGGGSRTT